MKWESKEDGPEAGYGRLCEAARKRGIDNHLTLAEYKELVKEDACAYCGDPLPTFGYGLDRKYSDKPYTLDNCNPCCKECNTEKRKLDYQEWLDVCHRRAERKLWPNRQKKD